jgi:hypothetical protein
MYRFVIIALLLKVRVVFKNQAHREGLLEGIICGCQDLIRRESNMDFDQTGHSHDCLVVGILSLYFKERLSRGIIRRIWNYATI